VLRIRIWDPVLFTPRIRDPGWSNGRIRDKQTKFVNSLYKKRGRIRDPVLFYPPDPESGSGMEEWSDLGSEIKHPGSATLGPMLSHFRHNHFFAHELPKKFLRKKLFSTIILLIFGALTVQL
jgi:hypothetical protein